MPPMLYGIDPKTKYLWTPERFRLPPKGWPEAVAEIRKELDSMAAQLKAIEESDLSDAEKIEKAANLQALIKTATDRFRKDLDALRREWADAPERIKDGAPVVRLRTLDTATAIRLGKARAIYEGRKSIAEDRLLKRVKAIRASKLAPAEQERQIEDLTDQAKEGNVERGISVYDEELIESTLQAVVEGWDNFAAPFVSWEESGRSMLPADLRELFFDLVDSTAFTHLELESFTSAPASTSD
jgi:hypothetical protein